MKKLILLTGLGLFMLRAYAVSPAPYTETVGFTATASTSGYYCTGNMTVYEESSTSPVSRTPYPSGGESPLALAKMKPGKQYVATFQGTASTIPYYPYNTNIRYSYKANLVAPAGYDLYINGVATSVIDITKMVASGSISINDSYALELRPQTATGPAEAGSFSGIRLGNSVTWEVGLGGVRNGNGAGRIYFKEKDLTNSPTSRDRLYYTAPASNGQIAVVKDGPANKTLRQISTPQVFVDLVDDADGGYWLKFYTPTQATWNGSIYTLSGAPWKMIRVESPNSDASKFQITQIEGSVSSISKLELTSGSVATGTYVWTLGEGGYYIRGAQFWLRTTMLSSTNNGGSPANRDVYIVTYNDGGITLAAKTKYHYVTQPWGDEEVVNTIADPDGAALTTTYDYYTDSSALGNYRKLKSVIGPTGNWSSYQYYDDWNRRGQLKVESHPFKNAPATVQAADPSVGYSISYDYTADYTGLYRNESSRIYTTTNIQTGLRQTATSVSTDSTTFQINDYASASLSQQSFAQIKNPTAGGYPEFHFQPILIQQPNKSTDVYAYEFGNYFPDIAYFTVASNGTYLRTSVWHGSSDSTDAESYTPGYTPSGSASLYLVPYKSTMDTIVRNPAGLIMLKESYVYTGGGAFTKLAYETFSYDVAGRLIDYKPSNGAYIHNSYDTTQYTGMVVSTIDASGVETVNILDALGRISNSTKKGVTASGSFLAQSDIITYYNYDGANHLKQTWTTSGSLSITSTATFDLAGRIATQTRYSGSTSPITTTYDYSAGPRIVTANLPNGGTRTTEVYCDGRLYAVTGNSVVNEFFSYSVTGTGNIETEHRLASASSTAVSTTNKDWLDRRISVISPSWGGATATQTWSYNSYGQLNKSSQTGMPDTLYAYNTLGELYRSGLDTDSTGGLELASTDRITESNVSFYCIGNSDWFVRSQTSAYAANNSAASTLISEQYKRVSNFAGAMQAESRAKDQYGNLSISIFNVDRSAKTATTDTTIVGSINHEVNTSYNGLLISAQNSANILFTYRYDDLGRQNQSIDPRTGTTTTTYIPGTNLVYTVTDPANTTQATYAYDSAGRITAVTNGLGKTSRCDYNYRDQKLHEWGDTISPVEYVYNDYGQQGMMKTYANATANCTGASWPAANLGTPALTTWQYDEATSLLSGKYDAANVDSNGAPISGAKCVSFTYTQAGQVHTRTNQRGLTATYVYYDGSSAAGGKLTGELRKVSYDDSTMELSYTYNRLGNLATAVDAAGTHTFNYNTTGTLELQSEDLPTSLFGSRRLTYNYDLENGSATLGRSTGFSLGTSGSPAADQNVAYQFQADGRLWKVVASGQTFTYGYQSNSHLIGTVSCGDYTDTRGYENNHDWTASRQTTWGSSPVIKAKFDYAPSGSPLDAIGQIKAVVKTGELFSIYGNGSEGLKTTYSYDDLSQLKSEQTTVGSSSNILPGRDNGTAASPGFFYDKLGNRTSTVHNGNTTSYNPNALNQYTTFTVPGVFDVAGAASTNATVTVNGSSAGVSRNGKYFFDPYGLDNSVSSAYATLSISDGTTTGSLNAFLPARNHAPTYDFDGNLMDDGHWTFGYDAENRLISCETSVANAPRQKLLFTYDYLNRRIQKRVYNWNSVFSSWDPISDTRFIYQGWNLIAEIDGSPSNAIIRSYVWGLDSSGTGQGAGGVGGLLMVQESSNGYLPIYDAMGNIHGLLDASGDIVAAYEYDAFGQTLRESGSYAANNRIRFSSKYTDLETGLVYYGNRYYNPSYGRFINRDPIEELGGVNLYGFCGNNAVSRYDYLGNEPDQGSSAAYRDYYTREQSWRQEWLAYNCRYDGDRGEAAAAQSAWATAAAMGVINKPISSGSSVTAGRFRDASTGKEYGDSSIAWYDNGVSVVTYYQPPSSSGGAAARYAPTRPYSGSALGNALRHVPLLGRLLGGVGDVISGIGNIALDLASFGHYGTSREGLREIGYGLGNVAVGTADLIGKVWNAPNTAIGVAWGVLGLVTEAVMYPFTGKWNFGISFHHNAIQFENNPLLAPKFMPAGFTLGNTVSYAPNYGPDVIDNGTSMWSHEIQHTYQGQITGLFYLPLHIIGKASGLLFNKDTEGPANFMERGPYSHPPRPWPWH